MKPEQDAFGQFLLASLHGSTDHEIIERDDGFISTMEPSTYFSSWETWPPQVISALALAQGRILDVGMGAGRHALYLQAQGKEIIGIDNSALAIDVAKERGVKHCRLMGIGEIDDSLGKFDSIIMLGNNWGLLGGLDEGRKILKQFQAITAEGAQVIAETMNPYNTNDPAHLHYHQQNRDKGRMGGQVRFRIRYHQYCGEWMDYLLASLSEVLELIDGTGWRLKQTFGDTDSRYTVVLGKE